MIGPRFCNGDARTVHQKTIVAPLLNNTLVRLTFQIDLFSGESNPPSVLLISHGHLPLGVEQKSIAKYETWTSSPRILKNNVRLSEMVGTPPATSLRAV